MGAEEKDIVQPQDAQGQTDAATDAQAGAAKPGGLPPEIQERVNQIIEKRLGRERKKWQSYEAWKPVIDFFSQNQEAAQKLQELIDSYQEANAQLAVASVEQKMQTKLATVETLLDLRTADPVFRQHEQEIRDYADELGLSFDTPQAIKLAYKAWRGEPAVQDKLRRMAEAEQKLQEAQRRKAGLLPGRGPVPAPKKKPTEMTDEELLAQHGYSLQDLIVNE
ncbi:MAG: hypothetical protein H5U04_12000 [Firmicutes bacterium]|nr:hypothetical protein [Bacillota bacterium]